MIILTHNSAHMIGPCLEALVLKGINQVDEALEIVVIDSSTRDNTAEVVRRFNIPLVRMEGNVSVKRNEGLRRAKGAMVVFLDSDCLPHSGWLKALTYPVNPSKGVVAVLGQSVGAIGNRWSALEDRDYQEGFIQRIRNGSKMIALDTRNVALDRQTIVNLGGFSEDQPSFEDMELGARITEAGYHIIYAPEAIVSHKHRTTLRARWKQSFWHSRGAFLYFLKHKNSYNLEVRAFARSLRIPIILEAWCVSCIVLCVVWICVSFRDMTFWIALILSVLIVIPALFNPMKFVVLFTTDSPYRALYYLNTSTAQRAGVLYQYLVTHISSKRHAHGREKSR